MRRLFLPLILAGLLASFLPTSLAQKAQKARKEVLFPQPSQLTQTAPLPPITDLSNVGEAKRARKSSAADTAGTRSTPPPAAPSASSALTTAPPQEVGVVTSIVASGAAQAGTGVAEGRAVQGPVYDELPPLTPEQEERMQEEFEEVNPSIPIPIGEPRKVINKPLDSPTEVNRPTTELMRADTLKSRLKAKSSAAASLQSPNDFVYGAVRDVPNAAAASRSVVGEPSLGNMGDIIFYTGNWYAARSANGGQTFTYVNPYNTFPSVNGGFCCDQLANFAPNQNMMLWALQYIKDGNSGTLRLARAVGGTAVLNNQWVYYDFDPQDFGFPTGDWMDYPNMSVASNFLYLASNVFDSGDRFAGSVVWRISLAQLAAGSNINYSFFKREDVSSPRLTQGAKTTMYWGSHLSTSQVRIHRWGDSDTQIAWNDVNINSYTRLNRDGVATSPDGTNWAARADSRMTGAWVANGIIGLMWSAKQGGQFPYPYTITARFNESSRALVSQNELWSSQSAWLYPTASVNSAGNLAGMVMFGGGAFYPGTNIWISDDVQNGFNPLTLYGATESTSGPTRNQWGDYHTVHPHKDSPNTWVGATYYIQNGGENSNAVPRYLWFGRERDFTCTSNISPTSQSFASGGGTGSVSVTSSTGACGWSSASNASWITINSGATGTGNGSVSYTVAANSTSTARTGTLTIAGRTFTVSQAASTCTFNISPTSVSAAASGLTSTVAVTTTAGCAWSSASNASWITINSGTTGTGNGSVSYTVAANSSTATRTGTLTIAGLTFTVTQAASSGGGGCTPSPISFGQTVNGTLQSTDCSFSDGSFYDTYTFNGTAGQSVVISMNSSAFDTYLFLLSPTGAVLASDDDGGGGTNSRIPSGTGGFTLPATGTYRILTNSFLPNTTGAYQLRLDLNVFCPQTPINVGQTVGGTLSTSDCRFSDGSYYDTYTFNAASGQQIAVTMSAAFDTYLYLLFPDGSLLAFDDDGGGGTNSRIPAGSGLITLPAAGTYQIIANSLLGNVTGSYTLSLLGSSASSLKAAYVGQSGDFDGDGRDDRAVWRASAGAWFIVNSSNSSVTSRGWGTQGDIPVAGDYDGDQRADLAVWRPDSGAWFIISSSTGIGTARGWGTAGDIPVPGDYDGDRRADLAVWRPDSGAWFIINSSTNTVTSRGWGSSEDIPVPGDYDGDGRTDLAVWRPSAGAWFIINSSNSSVTSRGWGTAGDIPVPGDYDGDKRTDLAVWRPDSGAWFIINSSTGIGTARGWGTVGDTPVPSDYDGDGRDDLAVWRGPAGAWFIINSLTNTTIAPGWGSESLGDVPVTPSLVKK